MALLVVLRMVKTKHIACESKNHEATDAEKRTMLSCDTTVPCRLLGVDTHF